MPRTAVSLTLDEGNLLWLKGRARVSVGGNLSEAVNQLIAQARTGKMGAPPVVRSVVGTIDLPDDDPELLKADDYVRELFAVSLARPFPGRSPAAPRHARSRTRRR